VSDTLRVTRDGPFARVTLDRPAVRNAFNAELIEALRATFDELAGEPPDALRGVVLAGAGPTFCAGADVEWMRAAIGLSLEDNERDAFSMQAMFAAIDACPVPVIARVQGAALGGGMGLCAVSDIVVASADASFGFTEVKLGIIPAVISPFALAKIGPSWARRYFVTGERFDAATALGMGLVHEVDADLDAVVDRVLAELANAGPRAARHAKRLVLERPDGPETARRIAERRTSAEGQEGLRAFLERRTPEWPS
jgi:methylglutaconyl-CoA hydratase